jgi:orotate phosphoribosyltransferase
MERFQRDFIDLTLSHEVLRFGQFQLKSGRESPYFFNLGRISSGAALARLARAYAQALMQPDMPAFDLLFGPAYKGIPLVTAVALALAEAGRDCPFAYNRKEAKAHGEGGTLVGAEVRGRRVVIVDDVLTAGTALRDAIGALREAGAEPVAALIALDRQEQGPVAGRSAVQALAAESGLAVRALVGLDEVVQYLEQTGVAAEHLPAIRAYQARHGVPP